MRSRYVTTAPRRNPACYRLLIGAGRRHRPHGVDADGALEDLHCLGETADAVDDGAVGDGGFAANLGGHDHTVDAQCRWRWRARRAPSAERRRRATALRGGRSPAGWVSKAVRKRPGCRWRWGGWTGSGTHQGELMGVAPTGKPVNASGNTFFRLEKGKIA